MTAKITTLENGLRVVTEANPHVETVSCGVWIDVGTRYETADQHGISHLLEHMVFKGTKTRNASQIVREIEAVGGHLNAYTSREHTSYYCRILKNDVGLALDLLADILLNSQFPESELEREREVVLQEIGQVHDTPDDQIFDDLQTTAFPDQALGRPILGTEETVTSFGADNLRDYMASHYSAGNMILAAAGNLDHERFCGLAEERFARLARGRNTTLQKARYHGGELRAGKKLEQLHLALGFESCSYLDSDYYAVQVYTTILGGGMSSRLFQEVREKRGLSYSVYAFNSALRETGLLSIYAGTGPEHVAELLPIVVTEMKALTDGVTEDEILSAKAQLKAGLLRCLESTSSRSEQIARQMLIFGRVLATKELVENVNAVDKNAVNKIAARILNSPISLVGIGDMGGVPTMAKVQESFFRS